MSALVSYWLLVPVLFGVVFGGLGLLLRRLTGGFRAELVIPAGIAVAVVISSFLTYRSETAIATGPVLLLVAAAGWALSARSLSVGAGVARNWPWLLAGVAGFAVFGASVFLSGHPTFTGYTQIVDIAHQFDMSAYVIHHGRGLPENIDSSFLTQADKNLAVGYPTGIQSVLAAICQPFGLELAWAYQPLLAVIAGSMIPVIYLLLQPVVASRAFRAVGAFVASQGSILIAYSQMGGIKELSVAVLIPLTVAFALGAMARRPEDLTTGSAATGGASDPSSGDAVAATPGSTDAPTASADANDSPAAWQAVLPAAVSTAATLAILSLTMLPWLGLVAVGALAYGWWARSLPVALSRGAVALGLTVLLAIPTGFAATKTGDAVSVVQNQAELGNLAVPVGKLAATGIWLSTDHRYPLTGTYLTATRIGAGIALALALLGLYAVWRRRAHGLLVLTAAGAGALAVIIYVMGPWVELKAFSITAPITLALAVAGLGLLQGSRRSLAAVGWVGLAVLLAFTLAGDVIRYRTASLAPYERLSELRDYGRQFAGAGPTLIPDFEEHGEYFMRAARSMSSVNPPPVLGLELTEAADKTIQMTRDLDEFNLAWLQRFDLIVIRRAPTQSRPPAGYKQVAQGRFYTVWRRTATPKATSHSALSSTPNPPDLDACRAFIKENSGASSITVAPAGPVFSVTFPQRVVSPNFAVQLGDTVMSVSGPGTARGTVEVPRAGTYDLYVTTNARRKFSVEVDGRSVGSITDNSYALRPTLVRAVKLTAGKHAIKITRGGGTLAPGTQDLPGKQLGPVVLVPSGQLFVPVKTTSPADARCPKIADWIEAR